MKLNIVPARAGFAWARAGVRTFWRQPLALAGLFFMFISLVSVASLIPYVGSVVALVLLPAATLGLMAATREADQGRFPMPSILITAFRAGRPQARSMLLLGAFYAAGFLGVLGASAMIDGGAFARMYLVGGELTPELLQSSEFQNAMWVAMALYVPFSMMFWHAPALVHWHGITPGKSVFFSFVACKRNLGAFALYLLSWLGLFLGVAMVVMVVTVALGQPGLMNILMFPTAMLLAAMFFSSMWFTFRDSFVTDEEAPSQAPDDEPAANP
ncbi:MAG: BPSS1780 family membrane protein [Hylemonella sp.]|nr:BPSS1780 family membrane protein [Hylemonella sp.]